MSVELQENNNATTTEVFVSNMKRIRDHYKTGHRTLYIDVSDPAKGDKFPLDAQAAVSDLEGSLNEFNGEQQKGITNEIDTFAKNKNYSDFRHRMEKREKKANEDAKKRIDDFFHKMIKAGEEHPESQGIIESVADSITHFFFNIIDKLKKFVTNLVNKIVEIMNQAIKLVGEFFSTLASTASAFFKSII